MLTRVYIMSVLLNLTTGSPFYDDDQGTGLEDSGAINSTQDIFKISNVKKSNTIMNSGFMFSFGVIGNLLALVVLKRSDSEIKRRLFYRLVAGLTLTDLLGTCATSPVVMSVYINDFKWIGGDPMCKYFTFMMIFAANGTMAIVCLMAIERLVCIRHPYVYYARLRKKHVTFFLLIGWTFAAFMASLPLMGFGKIVKQYPYTWCFIDYYTNDPTDKGFNYMFALVALTIITVTVTCNVVVLYTLFRTKMRGLSRSTKENSRTFSGYSRRYAECQMAVLLIGITVVFSSCYAPLMVRIVLNQTKLLPVSVRLDLILIRLASMNQILDPWVYILLRREIVWQFVSTVKKPFRFLFCKNQTEDQPSQQDFDVYTRQRALSSPTMGGNDNTTCALFCWHCLCDPPQRARNMSVMSSMCIEYNRKTIYGKRSLETPTTVLAHSVAENVIIPDTKSSSCDEAKDRRLQAIEKLKKQAYDDTDVVLNQPQKGMRVKLYSNGIGSISKSDSHLYQTLLETGSDSIVRNGEV